MTTDQLFAQLCTRDVQLSVNGGQLRVNAPRSELSPADVETIRRHKADLLAILSGEAHGGGLGDFQAANEEYWSLARQRDRDYLLGPRDWPALCPWCGGRLAHSPTCSDLQVAWTPVIPFGKYRGQQASEVPATYIAWILSCDAGNDRFRERLQRWWQTQRTTAKTRSSSSQRDAREERSHRYR